MVVFKVSFHLAYLNQANMQLLAGPHYKIRDRLITISFNVIFRIIWPEKDFTWNVVCIKYQCKLNNSLDMLPISPRFSCSIPDRYYQNRNQLYQPKEVLLGLMLEHKGESTRDRVPEQAHWMTSGEALVTLSLPWASTLGCCTELGIRTCVPSVSSIHPRKSGPPYSVSGASTKDATLHCCLSG